MRGSRLFQRKGLSEVDAGLNPGPQHFMKFGRRADLCLIHTRHLEVEMGLLASMVDLGEVATLPELAEAEDAAECLPGNKVWGVNYMLETPISGLA